MSINTEQFRELVVRPTLEYLDPEIKYSQESEDLLIMTAAHESNMGEYLKQINGPALGVYQMEPDTLDDIWFRFLCFRPLLTDIIYQFHNEIHGGTIKQLTYDLMYATVMARVHYYRVPEALPSRVTHDTHQSYVWALADYAKKYWNTHLGKATVMDYYRAYLKHTGSPP